MLIQNVKSDLSQQVKVLISVLSMQIVASITAQVLIFHDTDIILSIYLMPTILGFVGSILI